MERPKNPNNSRHEKITTIEQARQQIQEEIALFEKSEKLGVEGMREYIQDLQEFLDDPKALQMFMDGWNAAVGAQREMDAGF